MATEKERRRDRWFRRGTAVHRWLFTKTKGRVLGRAGGMPVVMLGTVGAKSGMQRSTMLTAPIVNEGPQDERIVLVASYGGDRRDPAWFRNLVANPAVTITRAGQVRAMVARVADADERADLWPRITSAYKGYAGYQEKTDRTIPVVIIEPDSGAAGGTR